ncbi:MAG: Fic family protein [Alphaproteobacteria bacterium]|nr:Fic family protein [Alphaproteobacteria bacterium]
MLFEYTYKIENRAKIIDEQRVLMLAHRMLPEYVFDTSQLENNPLTFPEVKTLLDGVTIGGHKISDVEQVLNIKNAWMILLNLIKNDEFTLSVGIFNQINEAIAKNEALYAGKFRNGSVQIAGTQSYQAPKHTELESIFTNEIHAIIDDFSPVEQAIRLFLWGSLNQFYWDGNKRTSRIIANGILISAGIGIFNIKSSDILEFNTLMTSFYDTRDANNITRFLAEKCITYLQD